MLSECLNNETFNKPVPNTNFQTDCCYSLPVTFIVLASLRYITVTLFKLVQTHFQLRFFHGDSSHHGDGVGTVIADHFC